MKKIIFIFTNLLLPLCFFSNVFASQICSEKPKIITHATKEQVSDFIKWEKHSAEIINQPYYPVSDEWYYIVDINNDGIKEYIRLTSEGSGGYLGIAVFQKEKKDSYKNIALPIPENFTQDGFWVTYEYKNPLTGQSELFVELCGKIYINVNNGSYKDPIREVRLWEKSEMKQIHSHDWIAKRLSKQNK